MALGTIARHILKVVKENKNINTQNDPKPMCKQTAIAASQQALHEYIANQKTE